MSIDIGARKSNNGFYLYYDFTTNLNLLGSKLTDTQMSMVNLYPYGNRYFMKLARNSPRLLASFI